MASGEIGNDHPHLNAQALISLNSALDAFVEEFVRAMRELRTRLLLDQLLQRAEEKESEALRQLSSEARQHITEAVRSAVAEKLPKLKGLHGSGIGRYEPLLEQEGLGQPSDRQIPADSTRRSPNSARSEMSSCIARVGSM
jgi:hypothetical protein